MRLFLLGFCYSFILSATLPALAGDAPDRKTRAAQPSPPKLDAWVWLQGDDDASMSGSSKDLKAADAQQQDDAPLLWVRRGGRVYVIRDADVLGRLASVWAPVDGIGRQMEALGKQMEIIGQQMESIGEKMARARRQELEALGLHMEALGKQMEPLGRQMDALGRDMDRMVGQAERDLAVLVDEAIKAGKAVEIR